MEKVLLVGAGNMAADYVKVLKDLDVSFTVVGRSEIGCKAFSEKTGVRAIPGGIQQLGDNLDQFTSAIVAVDAGQLAAITCQLMKRGINSVLTEKPGGLIKQDIADICNVAELTNSTVYIGYNRRFYTSVERAKKMIQKDGGVKSFHFEFTEWPHTVCSSGLPQETIDSWFLCNSSHIIDLAFYIGGYPKVMDCHTSGTGKWTKDKLIYVGAGVTDTGALFDYCANWSAPGRWGAEFSTDQHRFIFRPLERLGILNLRTIHVEDDSSEEYQIDIDYKPGLFREVSAFLGFEPEAIPNFKTMGEQLKMMNIYEQIAGRQY